MAPAQSKSAKVLAREAKQKLEKDAAKAERRAARLPHIPNPENVTFDDKKFDGYLLNSMHPRGKEKSNVLATAGFERVNAYDSEDSDVARQAANSNPRYLQSREALKNQLREGLPTTPADPKPASDKRERYDTRQQVVNSGVGGAKPLVTRAQWAFEKKDGKVSKTAHLASLVPAEWSSDEEGR